MFTSKYHIHTHAQGHHYHIPFASGKESKRQICLTYVSYIPFFVYPQHALFIIQNRNLESEPVVAAYMYNVHGNSSAN